MVSLSSVLIPVMFTERGVSPVVTGLVIGITSIPWVIKFVWGGIIDYFAKHGRKKFILIGALLPSSMSFLIIFIDPLLFIIPFSIALFFARAGVAFLDVSSDALSIEVTTEHERGKVNGSMFAGQFAGITFGSSVISFIAEQAGYSTAFLTIGLCIIGAVILPLLVKEPLIKNHNRVPRELLKTLRKNFVLTLLLLSPFTTIAVGLTEVVIPVLLSDVFSLSVFTVGLVNTLFSLLMVAGSLIGGWFSDKFSRKKVLFGLLVLFAVSASAIAFYSDWQSLITLWSINGFIDGAVTAVICALYMDLTNKRVAATQFSIYTGAANLGATIGSNASGFLINSFGYPMALLIGGLTAIPSLPLLHKLDVKKGMKEL